MTIKQLLEKTGWKLTTPNGDLEREITGVYVSDLLSWVMGRGQPDQAWITVQVHLNVVAIAMLKDFACVVLADGALASPEFIAKAEEEGLVVLESNLPSYETAAVFVKEEL
ncbi:MAG: AraC family transcriptional regulator [Erysipelotrichaceae bacterium]|nr:AraC family transcriptional regulator [Erysipelotrichaceae bacterium]